MKIYIGTVVLAGGICNSEQPYDFVIKNSRQVQIVPTMRATAVTGFDRRNQKTVLEFKVSKKHSSVMEAQAYVVQHAASLQDLPTVLTVVCEPSQSAYSLHGAVISEVQSTNEGMASKHSYVIVGGNFSKD
ncbi:MAG: hypothetical protein LBB18_00330 [Puniceicoccales bacterium]|jgi:hypothetical protein|nr:hypothetical protein [Puniceicoccales bacterium]